MRAGEDLDRLGLVAVVGNRPMLTPTISGHDIVKGLDDDAVEQLIAGDTKIMLLPKGAKVELPLDVEDVAQRVKGLAREDQVVSLLNGDKRLGAPQLRLVAEALNIEIPSAARSKSAIQLHIAQTFVAHRLRTYG